MGLSHGNRQLAVAHLVHDDAQFFQPLLEFVTVRAFAFNLATKPVFLLGGLGGQVVPLTVDILNAGMRFLLSPLEHGDHALRVCFNLSRGFPVQKVLFSLLLLSCHLQLFMTSPALDVGSSNKPPRDSRHETCLGPAYSLALRLSLQRWKNSLLLCGCIAHCSTCISLHP